MPVRPDPSQNFIHALSSFWTVFFRDTTQIQSYFQGSEINVGQLYLDMLETVLGTSLQHIPAFSRRYFKPFYVSEDELFYEEGASLDYDRYAYTPEGDFVASLAVVMNRVVSPTRVLEAKRDFDVVSGEIRFLQNLFDVDGSGAALSLFPVRSVVKLFAAEYTDLVGRDWKAAGVRVGDFFRFRVPGTGTPFNVRITGVDGATLRLAETRPEFSTNLRVRPFRATVLRKPFDSVKNGLPLPAHPSLVVRLSNNATDAKLSDGAATFNFADEPYYKGTWAPATTYDEGDLVFNPSTQLVRAITSHTSPAVYAANRWDEVSTKYVYVHSAGNLNNDGLYKISAIGPSLITLDRPDPFSTTGINPRAIITLVGYPEGSVGSPRPVLNLIHPLLGAGSVTVTARRGHAVYVAGRAEPYPADGAVIEGIDYIVDYDAGSLLVLSGWEPAFPALVGYTWSYRVADYNYAQRGAWATTTAYQVGDIVTYGGSSYVALTANADPAFTASNWRLYATPFSFNQTHPVREMALWGADVLIDRAALYTNFGYLLAFKRPSSEQYRAFLRGVAQLFVIGPALARFESALNVMAELPVVRDDAEILRGYDSGLAFSATDGTLIDNSEGLNATLNSVASSFTAANANFFASDVGAILRVRVGREYVSYVVTAVLSATTATISPTPPDGTGLLWDYPHVVLNGRFRSASYAFTAEDVDALIVVSDASNARNNGQFRIVTVENASTVILESTYGFTDESGLTWSLSQAKTQTITTSRAAYEVPLSVPVRPDIKDPGSMNTLTFQAFESLTDAFTVTDYVQDPTWWHDVTIPKALLSLDVEAVSRRMASPIFIEHRLHPLDQALVGDFGLVVGADDEGRPGIARNGNAEWYGGPEIVLLFASGVPVANAQDIGKYLTMTGPGFRRQFQIGSIDVTGTRVGLLDFPAEPLRSLTPPILLSVKLSPLLYRRTVGFVMMDRFLKYHAIRVRVDPATPLSPDFIGEAVDLLKQAKPGFTYVYFDTALDFLDQMIVSDQAAYAIVFSLTDRLLTADNSARVGPPGLLRANDAYRFTDESQLIPSAPGVYTLTPAALPAGSNVRFHAVKGRFDPSVLVGGTRSLTEGLDYTIDRLSNKISVLAPGLPAAATFYYVAAILRTRFPADPLDAGETPIAVAGSDPTTWWAPGQTYDSAGLIDRAIQLTPTSVP